MCYKILKISISWIGSPQVSPDKRVTRQLCRQYTELFLMVMWFMTRMRTWEEQTLWNIHTKLLVDLWRSGGSPSLKSVHIMPSLHHGSHHSSQIAPKLCNWVQIWAPYWSNLLLLLSHHHHLQCLGSCHMDGRILQESAMQNKYSQTVKCLAETSINRAKIIVLLWRIARRKNYMNTDTNEIWKSKYLSFSEANSQ